MTRTLRNLAIALLILTITVLAWLTDPSEQQNCEDLNDDVSAVVIGDTDDQAGMETRALGAAATCKPNRPHMDCHQQQPLVFRGNLGLSRLCLLSLQGYLVQPLCHRLQ